MCQFCEEYACQNKANKGPNHPACSVDLRAAIICHVLFGETPFGQCIDPVCSVNGRIGAPLNYCPTCGRKLEETP
nr:MAG TPA: Rad50 zinc hook motif [Caudoviricetes sp.]